MIRLFSSKMPFCTCKHSAVTRSKVTSGVAARNWSWIVGGWSLAVQQRRLAASQWACLYLTQQHSVIYWLSHLTTYSPAATATAMANNEFCNASLAHLSYITATCNKRHVLCSTSAATVRIDQVNNVHDFQYGSMLHAWTSHYAGTTQSSDTAEGPCVVLCQIKCCRLLHNRRKYRTLKGL